MDPIPLTARDRRPGGGFDERHYGRHPVKRARKSRLRSISGDIPGKRGHWRGRPYRWAFYRLTGVARAYPFVWYLAR